MSAEEGGSCYGVLPGGQRVATVTEREFWIELRRWLKSQIIADERLVAAIEKRFAISDTTETKDCRPTSGA